MDDAPALPLGDEASDDDGPCAAPGEPRTAEEFMRMMRRESRRMGDVFLAENEAERSANASVPGPAPAPSPRAPPAAWERSLLADLADARTRLDYHAARGVGSKKHARVAVPRMKDLRGWHAFCFGDTEPYAEEVEEEDEEEDEDEDEPAAGDAPAAAPAPAPAPPAVAATPGGTAPTTRLVLQFDGVMTQRLVVMHCGWLGRCALSRNRALWLYALLARLEKPVHRDTAAVLRELVKRLCVLRDALPDARAPEAAPLMALLVVAGRYYEQATPDELPRGT